jgi:hypothetical protein
MTNKPFITATDTDFLRAPHGCFADLVCRLNTALDEADRLDYPKDTGPPHRRAGDEDHEKDAAVRGLGEQIERLEDGR